jgi:hypothetical protein
MPFRVSLSYSEIYAHFRAVHILFLFQIISQIIYANLCLSAAVCSHASVIQVLSKSLDTTK